MRLPLPLIDTTGASDGDFLGYYPDTDEVAFMAPPGSLTVQDENGNVSTNVTQIDFQGAGVTATAGTGEVVVTIPGGGGGGRGTGNDPRWNVQSGETTVDEFNDGSLNAAWTRVDGTGAAAGNLTWSEGADDVGIDNQGGDSAATLHGLVRPLSGVGGSLSIGDGFISYVKMLGASANYAVAGLILADGATHGAGKQIVADIIFSATSRSVSGEAYTNWNTRNSSTPINPAAGNEFYIRLALISANTWRADASVNGRQWTKGSTFAQTVTPTHVGFCSTSYGTSTKHTAAFEFIRRVSGVT